MKQKLFLLLGSVATLLVCLAQAEAKPLGMAGCGLGSMIIESDGTMQIFAATSNGTFGTQTFGITTGTSNCVRSGVVLADKEQEAFFEASFPELKSDIAQGGGQHLEALAELFSCKDVVRKRVYERAQRSYATVFPSDATTPMQALYLLKLILSNDQDIAGGCIL